MPAAMDYIKFRVSKWKVGNQRNRNGEEQTYVIDKAMNRCSTSSSHSEVLLYNDARKLMSWGEKSKLYTLSHYQKSTLVLFSGE